MLFRRLYILREEENEQGSGVQKQEEVSSEETGSDDDVLAEEEQDTQDGDSEEEVVVELPQELAHLQQFAELTPEQVNALISNARTYASLAQDQHFKEYAFRAAQRLSGLDVPEPGLSKGSDNNTDDDFPDDLSDLDDRQVLDKYIDSRVEQIVQSRMQELQGNLSPILKDYSNRKIASLKEEYSNFDELLPQIEEYRKNNPASANLPIEDIIKIVDYNNAGKRTVNKIKKNKTRVITRPRGGAPNGKSKYTQEELNKMPLSEVIRISAEELGEAVPD